MKKPLEMNTIQIEDENFGPAFEYLSGILSLVDAGLLVQDYTDSHTTLFNEAFAVSPMGANYPEMLAMLGEWLTPTSILVSPLAVGSQCHAISALQWFQDPSRYEIHTGIVSRLFFHSWVFDRETNTIVEPTPYPRMPEDYYGVKVANPEIFFVRQKPRFEELLKTEPVLAADHGGDPRFLKNALIAALKHE